VQRRFEADISHLRAQHVEEHRALIHDDGAIGAGVRCEPRFLSNGSGVVVHQCTDGELVDGAEAGFFADGLLGVEFFGVARKAIADPDVGRRFGLNLNAPPL